MTHRAVLAPAVAYAIACLCLWPVPVIGMLHAEGSAVLAALSFFVAGLSAVGAFARGETVARVARRHIALLALPWAMLTTTVLWRPNCGYLLGLGLFLLMVPPSTLLGIGVARVAWAWRWKRQRLVVLAIGVGGALIPTLLTLKLHPQLFVYNAIYGGVLGPVYDAELALRPGLLAHRVLTLVWSVFAIGLADWKRGAGRWPLAAASVIAIGYLFSTPLGITQSSRGIERVLSEQHMSDRAVLHSAPEAISASHLVSLGAEVDFRLGELEQALGVTPVARVDIYLYPDEDTKAALIGSRGTSVVPVWLGSPQVHLLDARADSDLGHELVHVVAREFGHPLTGATVRIGLVEGLAVALEPPDGLPSPTQQTAVALTLSPEDGGLSDAAGAVASAMSPWGFWTGRAGVAYSTTGSFVRWLLDTYGSEPLRSVYRGADWSSAYGQNLGPLAQAWAADLADVEPTPEAEAYTAWRFSLPSLFEVSCPHHVPGWRKASRAGESFWDVGDLAGASGAYAEALGLAPDDPVTRTLLATQAERGAMLSDPGASARRLAGIAARDTTHLVEPRLALFRALSLSGSPEAAGALERALDALPPFSLRSRALIRLEALLSPPSLRALLEPRPDSLSTVRAARRVASDSASGALFAALLYAEAGDPERAWGLGQRAILNGIGDASGGEAEAASLDLVLATLALDAEAPEATVRLATRAAERLRAAGRGDSALVADDLVREARWRIRRDR